MPAASSRRDLTGRTCRRPGRGRATAVRDGWRCRQSIVHAASPCAGEPSTTWTASAVSPAAAFSTSCAPLRIERTVARSAVCMVLMSASRLRWSFGRSCSACVRCSPALQKLASPTAALVRALLLRQTMRLPASSKAQMSSAEQSSDCLRESCFSFMMGARPGEILSVIRLWTGHGIGKPGGEPLVDPVAGSKVSLLLRVTVNGSPAAISNGW